MEELEHMAHVLGHMDGLKMSHMALEGGWQV